MRLGNGWAGAKRPWGVTLLALLLLMGCGSSSVPVATSPAQTLSKPAYHFSLTIAANWTIVSETDDATASVPYTVMVQRLNISPGPKVSSLDLEVTRGGSPEVASITAGLATNSSYHATAINGVHAYATTPQIYYVTPPTLVPGQTTLPNATPPPGSPNTYAHTEYIVVTTAFLYTIYTEAVAGDQAEDDLNAMVQSLTLTP